MKIKPVERIDMTSNDELSVALTTPSRRTRRIAEALHCDTALVDEVWRELELDLYEDPHDLEGLKEIASEYETLVNAVLRIRSRVEKLPEEERFRLAVEGDILKNKLDEFLHELTSLRDHRKAVIKRNPASGGKDARADMLGELVAVLFERTGKSVTFGHDDNGPTTDFGRAVQEVLTICDNRRLEYVDKNHKITKFITELRQPAYKAYLRRKL